MTPQSKLSLALCLATLAGGLGWVLAYDLAVYLLDGRTATISHAVNALGRGRPWLPVVFVCAGLGALLFLAWHFWGRG
jgi:hypothetical protein